MERRGYKRREKGGKEEKSAENLREEKERTERGRREKEEGKRRENFVSTNPSQLKERNCRFWIGKQARGLTLVSFP